MSPVVSTVMKHVLIILVLFWTIQGLEARKRPKPKPKPQKWFSRTGVTTIASDGESPTFECSYLIKYKKNGYADWKKSKLRCKKVAEAAPTITTTAQPSNTCQVVDPDVEASMPSWPPLLLDEGRNLLTANLSQGEGRQLSLGLAEAAILLCPKTDFEHPDYQGFDEMRLRCGSTGLTLEVEDMRWQGVIFNQLGCVKQYREDFLEPGSSCGPQGMEGQLVHVGFTTDSQFFWQFTSCHQASRAHNLYVEHVIAAGIAARDQNNDRPSFSKDGFYSGYDINGMYTQRSQEAVLATLLGSEELAASYLPGGSVYLARGHLAPNADFLTYAWQDATFTFIDVAPQWQSFNAGNWLDVENGLRDLAEQIGELRVWTGTHGVLQLEDSSGSLVDIYLDEEGLQKVPVPRYFWKVVYHTATKRGLAVVGANNPHREEEMPCQQIEGEVAWLRFVDTVSLTSGPLTVCSVDSLAAAVPEFPGGLDTTGGLLTEST